MANRSSNAPDAIDSVATSADGRLAPQILTMFRAFMASSQRNKIVLLGVALVAVIGANGQCRPSNQRLLAFSLGPDCCFFTGQLFGQRSNPARILQRRSIR